MNAEFAISARQDMTSPRRLRRRGFTLVEILIVISIIAVLMTMMVAVVRNSMKTAKTAATSALIQKIDMLIDDRLKGFDRATKTADFGRILDTRKQALEAGEDRNRNQVLDPGEDWNGNGVLDGGIYGVSRDVLGAVARKDFLRENFPQRYADFGAAVAGPGLLQGVPTSILLDPTLKPEDANVNGVLDGGEDTNGNGVLDGYVHAKHNVETESSALLYFALTKLQVFGVPPVGESAFETSEYRDTDGDGLLEFVDAWGVPLRFYRWPTRLLKPNGILGADGAPGVAGANDNLAFDTSLAIPKNVFYNTILNGVTDDFLEFGKVGSDDITVSKTHRAIVAYLIDGLPSGPVVPGQWDSLSEDPDDPYGLISTEIKRLYLQSLLGGGSNPVDATQGPGGFNEVNYPTIDTYHTPLVISAGPDGDFGLYPPYLLEDLNGNTALDPGEDTNGNGFLDYGVLAQPIHGPGGPYDITSSVTSTATDVISALTDNLTNRNRRAGRGK